MLRAKVSKEANVSTYSAHLDPVYFNQGLRQPSFVEGELQRPRNGAAAALITVTGGVDVKTLPVVVKRRGTVPYRGDAGFETLE